MNGKMGEGRAKEVITNVRDLRSTQSADVENGRKVVGSPIN